MAHLHHWRIGLIRDVVPDYISRVPDDEIDRVGILDIEWDPSATLVVNDDSEVHSLPSGHNARELKTHVNRI
jgi:hypothetical protein